ncbi:lysophospholipase L1-like esterase [Paenibacillus cellulosilyticus]|uniref:Lysophospholipase L1-like esterase n=1 Tax=Paenibacillus cellulosilyticus TaxID=375489 RepID=A0A2V2YSD7_9BACL|nr:rhamnogalacturonan acetylesterase [Paenibacillus cellulosilyticus]PWW00970.1 lysophospholipase L1-like esterase [Paenibacillus cellulosilyticus]QKS47614.1 rhamnogalacturonan acetylesterase [Paenibacillus cellulosilyticus]
MEFGYSFIPDDNCQYDMEQGYGFALPPMRSRTEDLRDSWPGDYFVPMIPSLLMDVPYGNYNVTLTLGSPDRPTETTVKEGLGRLRLFEVKTEAGRFVTKSFAVHVSDGQLKLAFGGTAPLVQKVEVKRIASIPTIHLAGDSTVTDQPSANYPYTGWGQMFGVFVDSGVAIANYAFSGRSSKSFVTEGRLNRVDKRLRQGDYLLVQFAHNDEKDNDGGTEPFTTYQAYLQQYIDVARKHGAYPVLIAPMHRRFYEEDGTIRNTHGDYIEAMRQLARKEEVPFVDLAALSKAYFEELGEERSKQVFLWTEPGQYEFLPEGSQDNTHFSEFGGIQIARLVAQGIRDARIEPLARHLKERELQ